MWQLVLAKIPIYRWVIGPDVHGLLDVPGCALCLLMYYVETVRVNRMSHGTGMPVDGGRDPAMFFEPVPQGSASLTYIPLRTVDGWTLVLVYDPTFCNLVSLSLGAMSRVLMVFDPLKCTCMPFLLYVLL